MKALPFVTFFGTLVIIALLAVWQHQETRTVAAQNTQQLQQAQTTLQTVKSSAQANTARLRKLTAVTAQPPAQSPAGGGAQAPEAGAPHPMYHHKVSGNTAEPPAPSSGTNQTAAAISEAADTLKAAQAENEKITQAPAITAAPAPATSTSSSQRFIVLCFLTLFGCGLSTFFLVAKRFGPAEKQIASATLGTILGYWFSSAS